MVKPSLEVYHLLVDIVLEGDFRADGQWGGEHVSGYCYGGETIQGLMSYFVHLKPDECLEADSCRIDAMAIDLNANNETCHDVDPLTVSSFHFTACPKPWWCGDTPDFPLCTAMRNSWWGFRNRLEEQRGLPIVNIAEGCRNNQYVKMQ